MSLWCFFVGWAVQVDVKYLAIVNVMLHVMLHIKYLAYVLQMCENLFKTKHIALICKYTYWNLKHVPKAI